MNKAEQIKQAIKDGTYDLDAAIETTAEKIILLTDCGYGNWY